DLSTWQEGVEEYKTLTIDEMRQGFGLPSAHLPHFNRKVDVKGNTNPWTPEGRQALESTYAVPLCPFWHQWVGLTKIIDNMSHNRNVLIMDQVGVGKTLQAVGAIAMYEWLRSYNEQKKTYPPRWGNSRLTETYRAPISLNLSNDPAVRNITMWGRDRRYGVVVMDEAHYARKAGHTQIVCAELSKRARLTLCMTATPIVTSPMVRYVHNSGVLTNLGRLTGYCPSWKDHSS
ncbi:hypothetical protein C2E23DRAFT_743355, partial [Lenzites betulinus]